MNDEIRRMVGQARFVRTMSHAVLKGWPADKWAFQRTPADNHPLWVMGHIAGTDMWLAGAIGIPGVSVPESDAKLFGMGTKPTSNAADYPSPDALLAQMDRCRDAMLAWYEQATPAQLAASLKEKSGGFLEDAYQALSLANWHEGWHFGQVATLRKELGLPSAF